MSPPLGVERRLFPGVGQLVLRCLVVLGALVTVVTAEAAGARPADWVTLTVTGLAAVTALRPDSVAGVVLLLGAAYVWAGADDPLSPLVLVVAAGMVLVHVGALLAAQGPVLMRLDPAQALLWCERGILLWLASASVWLLATLVAGLPGSRVVYAGGLVLLVAVAVLATRLINPRRG